MLLDASSAGEIVVRTRPETWPIAQKRLARLWCATYIRERERTSPRGVAVACYGRGNEYVARRPPRAAAPCLVVTRGRKGPEF